MDSPLDFDYLASDPFFAMNEHEIIRARDTIAWDYSQGFISELDFEWFLSKSREALFSLAVDEATLRARLELEDMLDRALSWSLLDSLNS